MERTQLPELVHGKLGALVMYPRRVRALRPTARVAAIAVAALVLGSCRKPWAGTYRGSITQFQSLPVAGGAPQTTSRSADVDVVVTDGSSGDITVEYLGCKLDAHRGDTAGATEVAIARSVDCTFSSSPDVKVHLTSVSITLAGETLSWTWLGDARRGADSGSFGSSFSGARSR